VALDGTKQEDKKIREIKNEKEKTITPLHHAGEICHGDNISRWYLIKL
jgi:hypothetical protein